MASLGPCWDTYLSRPHQLMEPRHFLSAAVVIRTNSAQVFPSLKCVTNIHMDIEISRWGSPSGSPSPDSLMRMPSSTDGTLTERVFFATPYALHELQGSKLFGHSLAWGGVLYRKALTCPDLSMALTVGQLVGCEPGAARA